MKERLLVLFAELDEYIGSFRRLSQDMGKSPSYIGNILATANDRNVLTDEFVNYFQARFNVNPEWLYNGSGDMFLEGGKTNHAASATFVTKFYQLSDDAQSALINMIDVLYRHRNDDK